MRVGFFRTISEATAMLLVSLFYKCNSWALSSARMLWSIVALAIELLAV